LPILYHKKFKSHPEYQKSGFIQAWKKWLPLTDDLETLDWKEIKEKLKEFEFFFA
jgi:hypothetical protein